LYVEPLIGRETINTLPDKTLAALRDHGTPAPRLEDEVSDSQAILDALARFDINLDEVGLTLQADGVQLFERAFQSLLQQTG
jgi:transaldolase